MWTGSFQWIKWAQTSELQQQSHRGVTEEGEIEGCVQHSVQECQSFMLNFHVIRKLLRIELIDLMTLIPFS